MITIAVFLFFAAVSPAQRKIRHPPGPPTTISDEPIEKPKQGPPPPNYVELERKARELADLSATVPNDIEQLKKGLLSKDVPDKLKRIEKLSKQLRGTINP
jgi:hypothetical protein